MIFIFVGEWEEGEAEAGGPPADLEKSFKLQQASLSWMTNFRVNLTMEQNKLASFQSLMAI